MKLNEILKIINEDDLSHLDSDKRIIKKELSDGIISYNFSRDVFFKKDWDDITTKARGLFYNKNIKKIIARSYDKFFNIGEKESVEQIINKVKYPVNVYVKYNGFLGIVGYNNENDELFVASKSTNTGDFADIFNTILKNKIGKREKYLKRYLKKNNVSIVFEVIDPTKDPHIIEYKESDIIVLDIIYNTPNYIKKPYAHLVKISNLLKLPYKRSVKELNSNKEFKEYYDTINNKAFRTQEEGYIEGFIFEDAVGYMVKFKSHFYNYWKRIRGVKHGIAKIKKDHGGKIPDKYLNVSTLELNQMLKRLSVEIISVLKRVGQGGKPMNKEESIKKSLYNKLKEYNNKLQRVINSKYADVERDLIDFILKIPHEKLRQLSVIELRKMYKGIE